MNVNTVAAAAEPKPHNSTWMRFAGAIALLVIVAVSLNHRSQEKTDLRNSFHTELLAGQLATPAAFQARCGVASATHQVDGRPKLSYIYPTATLFVDFAGSVPAFHWKRTVDRGPAITSTVGEDFVYETLNCN